MVGSMPCQYLAVSGESYLPLLSICILGLVVCVLGVDLPLLVSKDNGHERPEY